MMGLAKPLTSLLVFPWCQDRAKGGIPFEEPAVLECFSQVCDAVCFVHQLKMVHRDIKSRNVFLCRTDLGDWVLGRQRMFVIFQSMFVFFFCFPVFFFFGGGVSPAKNSECRCLSSLPKRWFKDPKATIL